MCNWSLKRTVRCWRLYWAPGLTTFHRCIDVSMCSCMTMHHRTQPKLVFNSCHLLNSVVIDWWNGLLVHQISTLLKTTGLLLNRKFMQNVINFHQNQSCEIQFRLRLLQSNLKQFSKWQNQWTIGCLMSSVLKGITSANRLYDFCVWTC